MASPAEIVAKAPLAPGLCYTSSWNDIHKNGLIVQGKLVDSNGDIRAYLRESSDNQFSEGLLALKSLERHNIAVAKHLPFISTDGNELLLVENVIGPTLDESGASPKTFFNLAVKLGCYTANTLLQRERLLIDIYEPFQYILRDGIPVLVDLGMHLYDDLTESEMVESIAEEAFGYLRNGYAKSLPDGQMIELNARIDDFHNSVLVSL